MKVDELQHGQHVQCRTGRAGRAAAEYGPWRAATLHIQRDKKGAITIITLTDASTADFRPDDFSPVFREFCTEDYHLQIEGVT